MRLPLVAGCALVLVAGTGPAAPAGLAVPNPSFEAGIGEPDGWSLSGGQGSWCRGDAAAGERTLAVTGDGSSSNYWRSSSLAFAPGAAYQVRFRARATDNSQGTPVTGPVFCNRDLERIPAEWTEYRSVFVVPSHLEPRDAWLRFGQWHADGTILFDAVEVRPARPLYTAVQSVSLGSGERIDGRTYTFTAPQGGEAGNHSRPLAAQDCGFNTDRWVFGQDSYVTYRHCVHGRRQLQARVDVTVGYYERGELAVEVSQDGQAWQCIGRVTAKGGGSFVVPAVLLPADSVWVRLRSSAGRATGSESDAGAFQVGSYTYSAALDGDPLQARGSTRFVTLGAADPRLDMDVVDLGEAVPGGRDTVCLALDSRATDTLHVQHVVRLTGASGRTEDAAGAAALPPGHTLLRLPYDVPGAGAWQLEVELSGDAVAQTETDLYLAVLYESGFGERLPQSSPQADVWWASSGWKVSRTRPAPSATGQAVRVSAARGEAEAVQLVLRPAQPLTGFTVDAGELRGPHGASIPAGRVDVLRVAYVPVSLPSDPTGAADWWPDPLPTLTAPLELAAGQNQPLWVRVRVPVDAVPGQYTGLVRLRAAGYAADVPLEVQVFGFALPRRATCTTAFGFDFGNVVRYQRLTTEAEKRQVLDRYLASFGAHHISPYDPAPLDSFGPRWEGLEPRFSWEAWDRTMARGIDELGFNSFRLPIEGLGSGTFQDRQEPELLGHAEGTPEYRRAFAAQVRGIADHLRQRGWLDEAFVYWFDEPDPKDYPFVMNGFAKLKEHAPEIRRMLTEQVEPELVGGPDVWCAVSDAFDPQRAAPRRQAGDHFWWYVCTGPKAPYAGLFIDHAATELRVWLWQTWANGIDGVLVWESNYWTSGVAYPDTLQNPYADPMGWVSGYGTPAGTRLPWGNGDGRFLYPPEAACASGGTGPVLDGPVDSVRWEMLRDGVEDYEYFVTLRDLLRARTDLTAETRARYEALLLVPASVSASMTRFTKDPAPLEAHRQALASAIEALQTP